MALPKKTGTRDKDKMSNILSRVRAGEKDFTPKEKEMLKEYIKERREKRVERERKEEEERRAVEGEYGVDKKTGLKFKRLPGMPKEAIDASRKKKFQGITQEQLRSMVPDAEDFDLQRLNEAADLFLPHLRVAPSKEEIEELRKERKMQDEARQKAYAEEMAQLEEEMGSNDDGDNRH